MNIVLLKEPDWIDARSVRLDDHRAEHLARILKVTLGQTVRVGLINGDKGIGRITAVGNDTITLDVDLTDAPPPRHRTQLVLALPRPKMLRRILRTVAEFGVSELHLIHSYRVEKSFWQSPYLDQDKVEVALIQGLERAGDTLLPKVIQHRRFKPFMEDHLSTIADGRDILIAHPGHHDVFPSDATTSKTVLIGPEGGFIDYEVDLARKLGAIPVSLGHRIFSVDTAVCTALARDLT